MENSFEVKFLNLLNPMPMTENEAYRAAVQKWGIHSKAIRRASLAEGIVYQGALGSVIYAGWDQLPLPSLP